MLLRTPRTDLPAGLLCQYQVFIKWLNIRRSIFRPYHFSILLLKPCHVFPTQWCRQKISFRKDRHNCYCLYNTLGVNEIISLWFDVKAPLCCGLGPVSSSLSMMYSCSNKNGKSATSTCHCASSSAVETLSSFDMDAALAHWTSLLYLSRRNRCACVRLAKLRAQNN